MIAEMIEASDWESDESEDWESDEAFEAVESADDSAEDIGERVRRRKRQRGTWPARRRVSGVQGVRMRGQDGTVRNLSFPAKLATAAETNRGLASQELARRALAERLQRLEAKAQGLQRNDSSVHGLVTLAIGGGLAGFGAIQAGKKVGGSGLQNWAAETSTKTAAVVSASQLATSGAKLVINGRYHRSRIGIAADIFAAAQLAAFTFGSLNEPEETQGANDKADAEVLKGGVRIGTRFVTRDFGEEYQVVLGANNERLLRRII